jgi:hypothetical protein
MIRNSPYLLDITPADIFLFWRVKTALTGFSLSPESFKLSGDRSSEPPPKTSLQTPYGGGQTAVLWPYVRFGGNWAKIILKQLSL